MTAREHAEELRQQASRRYSPRKRPSRNNSSGSATDKKKPRRQENDAVDLQRTGLLCRRSNRHPTVPIRLSRVRPQRMPNPLPTGSGILPSALFIIYSNHSATRCVNA